MDEFGVLMSAVFERLRTAEARVEQLERRADNFIREAKVTGVDDEKGMAEVDADGLPSKMVPWINQAGAQRNHYPLTKGERALLLSPTGEPGRGLILPAGYSNAFKQPHGKAGEAYSTLGKHSRLVTKDKVEEKVGEAGWKIEGDTATLTAKTIVLDGTVKLGGADADKPAAMLGSVDSAGHSEQSNLATKVFVK